MVSGALAVTFLLSCVGAQGMDQDGKKLLIAGGIGAGAGFLVVEGQKFLKKVFFKEDPAAGKLQAMYDAAGSFGTEKDFKHDDEVIEKIGNFFSYVPIHLQVLFMKANETKMKQDEFDLSLKRIKQDVLGQLDMIKILNEEEFSSKKMSKLKLFKKKKDKKEEVDGSELDSVRKVALQALRNKKDIENIHQCLSVIANDKKETERKMRLLEKRQTDICFSVWGDEGYDSAIHGVLSERVSNLENATRASLDFYKQVMTMLNSFDERVKRLEAFDKKRDEKIKKK